MKFGCRNASAKLKVARQNLLRFGDAGVGTLISVDGNIDSQQYTQILDANLWPVVAKHFVQKSFIFQDDNAPVHSSKFTRDWKINYDIPGITWLAQFSDLNIIENVWRTIKLKLQSETEVIKTRAQLIDAVCRIWKSLVCSLYSKSYAVRGDCIQ